MELQNHPFPIPGVGVVIMHPSKPWHIVMGRRIGAHGANTWMIPGGKIDKWKTGPETAVDEVKEETDLDVEVVTLGGSSYPGNDGFENVIAISTGDFFSKEDLHFITLYYAVKIVGEEIEPKVMEPDKCEEWIWHDNREPLPEPLFLPLTEVIGAISSRCNWWDQWLPGVV